MTRAMKLKHLLVTKDTRITIGSGVLLLFVLAAIFAPVVAPHSPVEVFSGLRNAPPGTSGHLLGTDQSGRDILSRLLWGGRVTLLMGTIPVIVAMVFGTLLGIVAAWYGKWVEFVILRLMDVLFAFPLILLAILAAQALGKGMLNAMAAMAIVVSPYVIRAAHAAARGAAGMSYVEAALIRGASPGRIMFAEILPNILAPLVIFAASAAPIFVIFAAGLSYFGLAIQPPTAEWGLMIAEGQRVLQVYPHVPTIPGFVLLVITIALNLVGDGLQDMLDPKSGKRKGARNG